MCAALALGFAPAARAEELRVGPDGFETLAGALRSAHAGDTILISPDYRVTEGAVLIDVPLTIAGDGDQVTVPPLVVATTGATFLRHLRFTAGTDPAVADDRLPCALAGLMNDDPEGSEVASGIALCAIGGSVDIEDSAFVADVPGAGAVVLDTTFDVRRVQFEGWSEGALVAIGLEGDVSVAIADAQFTGRGVRVIGGALEVASSAFTGGQAARGASIDATAAVSSVTDSVFDGAAAGVGGAIYAEGGSLSVTGSYFRSTTGAAAGGAIAVRDADLQVATSVFEQNSATDEGTSAGGAISARGEGAYDVVIGQSQFLGPEGRAAARGGAIAVVGGRFVVNGTSFVGWSATDGGAVDIERAEAVLTDVVFTANRATTGGGAINATAAEVKLVRTLLCGNSAGVVGGGVRVETSGSLDAVNGRWIGNSSPHGAAIAASVDVSLVQGTLVDDVAGEGAVIEVLGSTLAAVGTIVDAESAALFLGERTDLTGGYGLWSGGPVLAAGSRIVEAPRPTDVTGDPGFVGYTGPGDCEAGLWLTAGSPAVDAGDPDAIDPDGTRADIGAYGGPDAILPDEDGDGAPYGADCDDTDPTIFPGAIDHARDGVDQDCDGVDPCDMDGDGLCGPIDCDDADSSVHPGAPELAYDGLDQDCDGADACDLDADGADDPRCGGDDCNDADPTRHPGAVDRRDDAIDQDCDGIAASPWLAGGGWGGCSTASPALGLWVVLLGALVRRKKAA